MHSPKAAPAAAPRAASPAAASAPLAMEDLPAFLRFAPVPVRPRHDGWSAALQMRFVVELARAAGVEEAARRVGRSPQSAYLLRGRAGAAGFAAAWDAATGFAGHARGAAFQARGLPGTAPASGIETIMVPRFYRGRLIGYTLREDLRGAMARLRNLDRLAARIERQGRTDELRALSEGIAEGLRESGLEVEEVEAIPLGAGEAPQLCRAERAPRARR